MRCDLLADEHADCGDDCPVNELVADCRGLLAENDRLREALRRPGPTCRRSARMPDSPEVGSLWEVRYRVLGRSKVWPDDYTVVEIVTGPDRGEKVGLRHELFSGKRTPEGQAHLALAAVPEERE